MDVNALNTLHAPIHGTLDVRAPAHCLGSFPMGPCQPLAQSRVVVDVLRCLVAPRRKGNSNQEEHLTPKLKRTICFIIQHFHCQCFFPRVETKTTWNSENTVLACRRIAAVLPVGLASCLNLPLGYLYEIAPADTRVPISTVWYKGEIPRGWRGFPSLSEPSALKTDTNAISARSYRGLCFVHAYRHPVDAQAQETKPAFPKPWSVRKQPEEWWKETGGRGRVVLVVFMAMRRAY